MRKISKPEMKVREVFMDCVDTFREPNRTSLLKSVDKIEEAERDYDEKKTLNQLYLIPKGKIVSNVVDETLLKEVYNQKLVAHKDGRVHYDKIKLSAPQGICPLCLQREVKTLDHYLPKAYYPLFSVTPVNLVPACSDCNKGKSSICPTRAVEETIHPYYDDIDGFLWLRMEIINLKPFIVHFYTDPPLYIPVLLRKRIKNHFDSFELNELYRLHAIQEFENNKKMFIKLYQRGGVDSLKEHLVDCYESRRDNHLNSWQTAFYMCISQNEGFCNGLFV